MSSKAGSEGGAPWQGSVHLDGTADHGEHWREQMEEWPDKKERVTERMKKKMSAESTDRDAGSWEPDSQALEPETSLKISAALFKVYPGHIGTCDILRYHWEGKTQLLWQFIAWEDGKKSKKIKWDWKYRKQHCLLIVTSEK